MKTPVIKPQSVVLGQESGVPASNEVTNSGPASPNRKRRVRPGWKATIVRANTFSKVRAIQKSTSDPSIDLSYLMDACVQMALESGGDAIVRRALEALCLSRTSP